MACFRFAYCYLHPFAIGAFYHSAKAKGSELIVSITALLWAADIVCPLILHTFLYAWYWSYGMRKVTILFCSVLTLLSSILVFSFLFM